MQAQHIALCQQFPQRPFSNIQRQLICILAGIGYDLHSKGMGDGGYPLTDVAKADDAEGLSCEFCQRGVPIAEVGAGRPFSCAVLDGVMLCVVGDGEQM